MKEILFFVLLLVSWQSAQSEIERNSDVLDLTDSDFSTRIAETETTLAMFYAPWCGKYN